MARTYTQIRNSLIDSQVAAAAALGITIDPNKWISVPGSLSQTDYKLLQLNSFANSQQLQEQLYDAFTLQNENISTTLPPQTPQWFRDKMLNLFEYDAIAVPIVQLRTVENSSGDLCLTYYYPNPNPAFNIIKFCSVVPGILGTTDIKIAGGVIGAPTQITGSALSASQTFANLIGIDGLKYNVISGISDKIYLAMTVFYNGLYSSIIQANVKSAITNYLASIPFNGIFTLSDLERYIKDVIGVYDVVFTNVQARDNGTSYGSGTNLVIGVDGLVPSGNIIQRNWQTVAGYLVTETTATHTIDDSITYIAQ